MSAYEKHELDGLRDFYRSSLLDDTLPFWMPDIVDAEFGGYLSMRDRDGSLLDDDKSVWLQGRFAWMLATLHRTVEPRPEWLAAARSGVDFLREHCFDEDDRMFFLVTRDGKPLRKRRYFFSEAFAVMAFAAYGKAAGDEETIEQARQLFRLCVEYIEGRLPAGEPKWTAVRPAKSIGVPMIFLQVAQQLVETVGDELAEEKIEEFIDEIRLFVKDDCVMEQVAPDGSVIDHIDGRTLNPGHAIEGAWFILHEAMRRGGDAELTALGCRMLDSMWKRGWDEEYGGILYFTDVHGKPVQEYWHDMKFWWPQCEAIIATLLAYRLTGEEKYARWHRKVHAYAHEHFHDAEFGEWFGYLHRDGRLSSPVKGNQFKGPFHLPRMQWYCWRLLE
ncbi:MAG: N-acylglucosamine 2-epimerase [Akkermansiaceae bacterium]|nr:N-acylglucosamine 2-epimerase [Akkermansiaceae bacterium]